MASTLAATLIAADFFMSFTSLPSDLYVFQPESQGQAGGTDTPACQRDLLET